MDARGIQRRAVALTVDGAANAVMRARACLSAISVQRGQRTPYSRGCAGRPPGARRRSDPTDASAHVQRVSTDQTSRPAICPALTKPAATGVHPQTAAWNCGRCRLQVAAGAALRGILPGAPLPPLPTVPTTASLLNRWVRMAAARRVPAAR
jgi:hypothetical protein